MSRQARLWLKNISLDKFMQLEVEYLAKLYDNFSSELQRLDKLISNLQYRYPETGIL